MTTHTFEDQVEVIGGLIHRNNNVRIPEPPTDLVVLLAALAVGHEVVWLSSDLNDHDLDGEVILFTREAVLRVVRHDRGLIDVTASGRKGLRTIGLSADGSDHWDTRGSRRSWPNGGRVTVRYEDGSQATLPLGTGPLTTEAARRFAEFLPTLVADLG
jgi:hypothetical protein